MSKDPVTGDELTLGEQASWMIQRVMRRWAFLGIITAITAYVWIFADPVWRHPVTDQWNLWASYLAIIIEGVTAMALINQTRRDAVVIREIRTISQRIDATSQKEEREIAQAEAELLQEDTHMLEILRRLEQLDERTLSIVQRLDTQQKAAKK